MTDWRARARAIAAEAGIDPATFERQIDAESGFNVDAVSSAGAIGLAQIVERWHPSVDPRDPEAALRYAARWMAQLIDEHGSWRLALAAYNAGPGNVAKHGGVPPFAETRGYLTRILGEGWPEPAAAVASRRAFDPATPTERQRLDWTCSIRTVTWMLRSLGVEISAEQLHDRMVPGLVTSEVGLRDARGVGLVEVLGWFGILGGFDESATWEELLAIAGAKPLGLGLRNWGGPGLGHWSAVRGAVDGRLVLANPARGATYGHDALARADFEARGPGSMVWAEAEGRGMRDEGRAGPISSSLVPDPSPLVGALAYVCDDLGDQLGAMREELRRVREQFLGARS